MSNIQVNPEVVINNLLETNKQLTLQNAMLRALIEQQQGTPVESVETADLPVEIVEPVE